MLSQTKPAGFLMYLRIYIFMISTEALAYILVSVQMKGGQSFKTQMASPLAERKAGPRLHSLYFYTLQQLPYSVMVFFNFTRSVTTNVCVSGPRPTKQTNKSFHIFLSLFCNATIKQIFFMQSKRNCKKTGPGHIHYAQKSAEAEIFSQWHNQALKLDQSKKRP